VIATTRADYVAHATNSTLAEYWRDCEAIREMYRASDDPERAIGAAAMFRLVTIKCADRLQDLEAFAAAGDQS